jgi:glycosyltransferase involved in cell wall biosynthesis
MTTVPLRALHFHDAAGTGARLVAEARREGMGWDHMEPHQPVLPAGIGAVVPTPAAGRPSPRVRVVGTVERASRPLRSRGFAEYLRFRAAPYDVLHVHGGHKAASARLVRRPVAVHLHGSDVRLMQYDPVTARSVREGVAGADLAVFATPDLTEHVARIRPDAHYLPVPISTADLPPSAPVGERAGVFFVSRWSAAKGGEHMLELAARVREKAPDVPLIGVDWGDSTDDARRIGVTLLPRQEHDAFLRYVAGARVAIGQANPMLGTSELEALALGLPLIGTFDTSWYDGLGRLNDDDLGSQADAVIAAHRDTEGALALQQGGEYVAAHHETSRVLHRLLELYRTVL